MAIFDDEAKRKQLSDLTPLEDYKETPVNATNPEQSRRLTLGTMENKIYNPERVRDLRSAYDWTLGKIKNAKLMAQVKGYTSLAETLGQELGRASSEGAGIRSETGELYGRDITGMQAVTGARQGEKKLGLETLAEQRAGKTLELSTQEAGALESYRNKAIELQEKGLGLEERRISLGEKVKETPAEQEARAAREIGLKAKVAMASKKPISKNEGILGYLGITGKSKKERQIADIDALTKGYVATDIPYTPAQVEQVWESYKGKKVILPNGKEKEIDSYNTFLDILRSGGK